MKYFVRTTIHIINRKYFWQLFSLLGVDIIWFGITNARNVPSFMLIIAFLLLALTLNCLIFGFLTVLEVLGLQIKRKRWLAGTITGLMSILLALQSIDELSPRDVLVLLPLVALGYLYSFYNVNNTRNLDR